jgi:hypothetical protein
MRRLRSTEHFLCVPLPNAANITRAIAPVNRQNRGIVKIWVGVADSPRIGCHRRPAAVKGDATNAVCSRSSRDRSVAFRFPKSLRLRKPAISSRKRHYLLPQGVDSGTYSAFHSLRGRSNSNGARFMASQRSGQKKTVKRVMHEYKHGELKAGRGRRGKVKNRKQAIAIALHEAGASNQESPAENKRNLAKTKRRERTGKTAASSGRKTAGRKTAGRKTTGRKTTGRKTTGRKTGGRKTASRSTSARKSTRKSTGRKSTARRSTTTKRPSASRSTARTTRRKSTARSTASRTKRTSQSRAKGRTTRSKSTARSHK